jgi:hypothetical protein
LLTELNQSFIVPDSHADLMVTAPISGKFFFDHGQIFFTTEKHKAGFSHGWETTAKEKVRPASPVEIAYTPISKVVSRQ